jgi:hypothetical protein
MPHPVALAILAGLVSSALFLSVLTGFPGVVLLAYFVQLPLLFVGLTLGLTGSMIAAATGLLVNGLIAGFATALIYALVQIVPALFVVRQALLSRQDAGRTEWFPPGLLLAQLTALAAGAIIVAFLVFLNEPGGLEGAIEAFVTSALREFGALAEGEGAPPDFGGWIFVFPGLMATSWLVMIVVNAVLAQALAVRIGWNRRPSPDIIALELPWWLWPAIGLAVFLSLLGETGFGFLGRSLLMVLVVPYVFLGLAVLHAVARKWTHPGLILAALYGSIVVLGWPLLAVLVLGLVEDWAGLRRRLT